MSRYWDQFDREELRAMCGVEEDLDVDYPDFDEDIDGEEEENEQI